MQVHSITTFLNSVPPRQCALNVGNFRSHVQMLENGDREFSIDSGYGRTPWGKYRLQEGMLQRKEAMPMRTIDLDALRGGGLQ
jgi:hypothetical protein